jgi:hypothetical protein
VTPSCSRWLLALVLLIGCGDDHAPDAPDDLTVPLDAGGSSLDARAAGDASRNAPALDSGGTDAAPAEESVDLYAGDRVVDIQIELPERDWDTLREQGRTMQEVFSGCADPAFAYSKFAARVRVDGTWYDQVAVRKKGFLGSLSVRKPSLRLDFDEYRPAQTAHGAKSLTLNNAVQDPALIKQCLAYGILAQVGIPAPRCSFARVTLNGRALGIYSNVEPIKKPLLRRVFGESAGNLYEGQAPAEFETGLLRNFEKKTHEDEPGKAELEALAQALREPDDKLVAALDRVLDLESYYRYWAAETLLANWDSYDGNQNNFFVYWHPDSQKLSFLPWGVDGSFVRTPWTDRKLPLSVLANSLLASRLYAIEATRERYRGALRALLGQWDEPQLLREIDRMAQLVGPSVDQDNLELLRVFVRGRRAELLAELDGPAPSYHQPPQLSKSLATCHPENSTPIRGHFHTTWLSDESALALVDNTIELTLDGQPLPTPLLTLASANKLEGASALPTSLLRLVQVPVGGDMLFLQFAIGGEAPTVGDIRTHGFETFGVVGHISQGAVVIRGFVSLATLHFEQAGSKKGDPIVGSFEGTFVAIDL